MRKHPSVMTFLSFGIGILLLSYAILFMDLGLGRRIFYMVCALGAAWVVGIHTGRKALQEELSSKHPELEEFMKTGELNSIAAEWLPVAEYLKKIFRL